MQKSLKKCGLENNYSKYGYEIWDHKGEISEIQIPPNKMASIWNVCSELWRERKKSIEVLQPFKSHYTDKYCILWRNPANCMAKLEEYWV